jgi:hypothetical protein
MPKVIADITMSLDGFVTGEGADEQHGLGDAPELHTSVMQQDTADTQILASGEFATRAGSEPWNDVHDRFVRPRPWQP